MSNQELNSLISLANDKLMCGPECKKDRQTEQLREIYNKSKQNLIDAPSNFTKAEKNYLIDAKGENEYKNIMKERTIKTINDMKKKLLDKHTDFINDIRANLNQYNTDYIYYNRMDDFYKSNLKDNKKYKREIGDFKSNVNVNNRKVFYEDGEMVHLSFVRTILLVIYFATLIAILYKIDFINRELYKNKYVLFVLFSYIMFGIYVDWFTKMIYYIKIKLSHMFENDVPRNVYVSM
jgi:hypothetical protein